MSCFCIIKGFMLGMSILAAIKNAGAVSQRVNGRSFDITRLAINSTIVTLSEYTWSILLVVIPTRLLVLQFLSNVPIVS